MINAEGTTSHDAPEPQSAHTELPDNSTARAPLECDLIMKGGITSGIVYPRAIFELSKYYRLRAIGGASAGAIAAACAAAAEYRRTNDKCEAAFDALNNLPDQLADEVKGDSLLLRLFKPETETRNVLRWFLAGLTAKETRGWRAKSLALLKWAAAALRYFPIFAVIALASGGAVAFGMLQATAESITAIRVFASLFGVVSGLLLAIVTITLGVVLTLRKVLPSNFMGLVSGSGSGPNDDALTPWLNRQVQKLAGLGLDKPLTFGALWCAGRELETAPAIEVTESYDRAIDLRVMTTALSHSKAYSFPLEPEERFYFDPAEFERLFPPTIVAHLLAHGRAATGETDENHTPDSVDSTSVNQRLNQELEKRGLRRLPAMADLPILVPVRMSLAFPLLLSAIPLHRKRFLPQGSGVIERVWFSDGGIISNFPIHFFDSIIPTRPTFGIDLAEVSSLGVLDEAAVLPKTNRVVEPGWIDIEAGDANAGNTRRAPSLLKFLTSIITTLHGWNDATQMRVPGFRDRIAEIRLGPGEGGINLRMSKTLTLELAERGRRAGQLLCEHFVPSIYRSPTLPVDSTIKTTWSNHRWVRFRTAAKLLEEAFAGLRLAELKTKNDASAILALHLNQPSYKMSKAQAQGSIAAYEKLIELAEWFESERQQLGHRVYDEEYPKPHCQLRIRPRT